MGHKDNEKVQDSKKHKHKILKSIPKTAAAEILIIPFWPGEAWTNRKVFTSQQKSKCAKNAHYACDMMNAA